MTTSEDCAEKAELDTGSRARRLAARLRRRVSRARRDERGLTTLEWLLIVAAVAGLAALAVVLVTNVVDNTSEQISGSSARLTAARVAAQEIVDDAGLASANQQVDAAKTWGGWKTHYTRKCNRLAITYGDAGITVAARFVASTSNGGDDDPVLVTLDANKAIEVPATSLTATAASGIAQCGISGG